MSISGLRKASWYNPETGTVVQANDIAEDGEFYTRAIEDPDDETATGEPPYAGDESYCQLMIFDMSLLPQLKAWKQKDTRVSMVAAGVQQNIQWYERDLLKKVEGVYPTAAGRRNHINVVMERVGHGKHDIWSHVNLLAHLGTTADPWTDADADGNPDGYEVRQASSPSFIEGGNRWETYATVGETLQLLAVVVFPIEGITVTLSVKYEQLHDDGDTGLRIEPYSYSSILQTSKTSITSTTRESLQKTLPSLTYELVVYPAEVSGVTAQNAKAKLKPPCLRIDGSDQYVSY